MVVNVDKQTAAAATWEQESLSADDGQEQGNEELEKLHVDFERVQTEDLVASSPIYREESQLSAYIVGVANSQCLLERMDTYPKLTSTKLV